jgi:hypothetical protein
MDALSLSANHIDLKVDRGDFLFESGFPVSAEIIAGMEAGDLHVITDHEIELEHVHIPLINIIASDIEMSPEALFGVSARIAFEESLNLNGLTSAYASVPEISHSIKASVFLGKGPLAAINVEDFMITSPFLSIEGLFDNKVETALDLDVKISDLQVKGLDPLKADTSKVKMTLDIDSLLRSYQEVSAYGLGSESLDITGQAELNVENFGTLIPLDILSRSDLEGAVDVEYEFHGRLPQKDEILALTSKKEELSGTPQQFEFLKNLQVSVSLKNLGIEMPFGDDSILRISQIQADPFQLILDNGLRTGRAKAEIIGLIEDLPYLGRLEKPINLSMAFSVDQEDLKTIYISETISTDSPYFNQTASISLNHIDKLFVSGLKDPIPSLLKKVDGSIFGKVQANLRGFNEYKAGLSLDGTLEAGADIYLEGGREVGLKTWLESTGMDGNLKSIIRIANLESHISMEKSYAVLSPEETKHPDISGHSLLSSQVLNTELGRGYFLDAGHSVTRRIRDDLRGRFAPQRSLSFDSVSLSAGPLPLEIRNHEMEFSILNGLLNLDYFQMEILGGTMAGYLSLSKSQGTFMINMDCSLSGLDASRLSPEVIGGISGKEAELSGNISISFPLHTDTRRLLQDLNMNINLTHIGSRTLERILYAMDPYESNEAIINQRKLLRMGSPLWIRILIENGNLSLSGQVQVKGMSVDLPSINRINLADLPLQRRLEPILSKMENIIKLLEIISSDSIYIGDDGIIAVQDKGR